MKEDRKTPYPVETLVPILLSLICGMPVTLVAAMFMAPSTTAGKMAAAFISPLVFVVSLVAASAVLSMPFHRAIIPGQFPRSTRHFIYGPRRLYGLCWGAIFYFTPVYYLCMSFPPLKRLLLRGFGYRASMDVNFAPDAWIRDLPLLHLGGGSYIGNKSSIGTNMCLADGSILVGPVTLHPRSMIGHLSKIGLGCTIGEQADVGIDCAIGIRAQIGARTRISPLSLVNHGAMVGDDVEIGSASYIGVKAHIGSGLRIPGGANIPEGADLKSQSDVESFLTSETQVLRMELRNVAGLYAARAQYSHLKEAKTDER